MDCIWGDEKVKELGSFWLVAAEEEQAEEKKGDRAKDEAAKVNDKLVVLIKPDDKSTYEDLVSTLDELTVTGTSRYALVTYDPEDKALVDAFTGSKS